MSRGEVHAAVLAFLDQFIERGAAPDIVSFRDRLASDPNTGAQLDDALPGDSPSEREAFDAMRTFFESQAGSPPESPSGPPGLWELSWWTAWGRTLAGDEVTSDPAMWSDWLDSVERATQAS